MNYTDKEIKVLDVNVPDLMDRIRSLQAKEVFNADRVITHFDNVMGEFRDRNFKLTEEEKLKLSVSSKTDHKQETVKLFVSRKQECIDLLNQLGFKPIAQSTSHRTSFEWEGIDLDIDQFPQIPPFIEIDLGDSSHLLQDILTKLGLGANEFVKMSTPEIYKKYDLDYFKIFAI